MSAKSRIYVHQSAKCGFSKKAFRRQYFFSLQLCSPNMLSSFKTKIGNVYCSVYILELLTSVCGVVLDFSIQDYVNHGIAPFLLSRLHEMVTFGPNPHFIALTDPRIISYIGKLFISCKKISFFFCVWLLLSLISTYFHFVAF